MRKVSAILLKYERHEEREQIIEALKQYEFIDEIIVHDNTKENIVMYGRYFATRRAKNDLIYVQDDDCIVENLWQIYAAFSDARYSILVNGMKPERIPFYLGSDTLMGWGAFFNRSWVNYLDLYLDRYGMDSLFFRECDRIFTTLLTPFVPRLTLPAKIRDFPSSMSPTSLSLQHQHERSRIEAVQRCERIIYDNRE